MRILPLLGRMITIDLHETARSTVLQISLYMTMRAEIVAYPPLFVNAAGMEPAPEDSPSF